MLLIFLTEYENEGKTFCGPCIISKSWDNAEKEATRFNLKIVGTLVDEFPSSIIEVEEKRVLH
jgi:hypothetical protein|tara:strand:- start:1983 stop:2171 length:189 start_codon:yes stop_codon:yes gene_type:complete